MNDRLTHARQWLAKARSDLLAAERLVAMAGPFDAVCFHAQQAAEKALKALLAFAEAPIIHTHNLEELQAACRQLPPTQRSERLDAVDLSQLTPFAVDSRYDIEFWPDETVATSAVVTARDVCEDVAVVIESRS